MANRILGLIIVTALLGGLSFAAYAQQVTDKPDISTETKKSDSEDEDDLTATVDPFDYRSDEKKKEGPRMQTITKKAPILRALLEINAFGEDRGKTNRAVDEAIKEARRIDNLLSTYQKNTEIARINAGAGREAVIVSPETMKIIQTGLDLSARSDGAFDITWAVLRNIWKFDLEESPRVPTKKELEPITKLINYKDVKVDAKKKTVMLAREGMKMDVGGLALGYVMQRVAETLRSSGINDFRIRIDRSVMVSGTNDGKPWLIKVPDVRSKRTPEIPDIPLESKAMFTSWDKDRYFEVGGKLYHSKIDPKTGFPARGVRSVTLVTDSPIEADALAVAVFVLGVKEGLKMVEEYRGVEAIITDSNDIIHKSKGWDSLYDPDAGKKQAPKGRTRGKR